MDGVAEPLGLGGVGRYIAKTGPHFPRPTRDTDVKSPSGMLAMGDAFTVTWHELLKKIGIYESWGDLAREGSGNAVLESANQRNGLSARKRHQGKLNMVFCDGHVEGLKLEKLFYSKADADLRLWNVDHQSHRGRIRYFPETP